MFIFAAAFPFFNNVDEQAHVDLVMKYARGHWPDKPLEPFDADAARLIVLHGSREYLDPADRRADAPRVADSVVEQDVQGWTRAANYEANSPPVYYAVAGAWFALGGALGLTDGEHLYWIRFLNVPLVVALVLLAYRFCRDFYPGRNDLRLAVPALVAFLPQDLLYSVNSDVLSPVLFSWSLMLLLTWYCQRRPGAWLSAALGLMVALTFLVKYTNVALPIVLSVVVFVKSRQSWRDGELRDALAGTVLVIALAMLPIAVCLVRNYLLFGDLTASAAKVDFLGWSDRPLGRYLAHPIFTVRGALTFWIRLMETFWRGEFVWHAKRIASPIVDNFYVISSSVMLIYAASAWKSRTTTGREPVPRVDPAVHAVVWASVTLSVLFLAYISVTFEYGQSVSPSQQEPYFAVGRYIAGAMIPFFVLYVDGAAVLFKPFAPVAGPLVFAALTVITMTVSEIALSAHVFSNHFNWFHLLR